MDDLQLRDDGDGRAEAEVLARGPGAGPALLIVALLALGAGGAYWYYSHRSPVTPPVTDAQPARSSSPAAPPPVPLAGAAEPLETLPPLDGSDEAARSLVGRLSTHPLVTAWLATTGIIRHLAAALENVSSGQRPLAHARAFAPTEPFRVQQRGATTVIDPQSYRRYDAIADALASVDTAGVARVYATLRPRLTDANAELGLTGQSPDNTVERAIVVLLATPVPDDPIAVVPKGIGYAFADSKLEALAPVQKQLLRMGPANARRIQASLRTIAAALGIPGERLSNPTSS